MQNDLGFTGSHWTPPSGDYSLRIGLVATRATINKTMMQNIPSFSGCFDGHRDAALLYHVHRPMEEVCGFHKSH
jgi:hypothetical protein